MIKTMLDTDLYKLTMMQFVYHKFPNVQVKYEFKCRNKGIDFSPYLQQIDGAIDSFKKMKFTTEEINYLRTIPCFKKDFLDFLVTYHNNANRYETYVDDKGDLSVNVYGTWLSTILAEVPVLSIVNELYFTNGKTKDEIEALKSVGRTKLRESIENIKRHNMKGNNPFRFMEFGTRRRFSYEWQREVVSMLKEEVPGSLVGTSNVAFAKEFNVKPLGTMAHEFVMAHQSLYKLEESQKMALQNWAEEYRGQLGIALSDTLGIDAFLRDFDLYFAKLYDGVRQDSGDPIEIYTKVLNHYKKLGVDPSTKTIIFSDGLTVESALEIKNQVTEMMPSFGIGTSLTNNMGVKPLQIVMKVVECDGKPVAKISESRGKTMCKDQLFMEYLKKVFLIK